MKKTILLFIVAFLFLTFTDAYSQPGWQSQNSGTNLGMYGIWFYDENNGVTVGKYGAILTTTNGGTSWIGHHIGDSWMRDTGNWDLVGTAVGDSGTILKTTNGGTNWTQQYSYTVANLTSVSLIDANTGWVVGAVSGYYAVILKTTNGGTNWGGQTSWEPNNLNGVSFYDANTGWVVGDNGKIRSTTNGGTNWVSKTSGTPNHLRGVSFVDANTGWAVGDSGTILRTTNGGLTWTPQISGTTNDLNGLTYPPSAQVGYSVGDLGTILFNDFEKSNWTQQTSGTTKDLYDVCFIDSANGWVVGDSGTILRTTNGGVTFINQISSEIPEKFSLYQNYPNPFNPTTNIRYDIQKTSVTRLIIYDALGREVATLVNEVLKAGSYQFDWDGSNYPSGVYFYKLSTVPNGRQADGFSDVKKMVLVK